VIVEFEVIARGHLGRVLHEMRATEEFYRPDGLKVYVFDTKDGKLQFVPEMVMPGSKPEKHLQAEAVRVAGLPMDPEARTQLVLALNGAEMLAFAKADPPIVKRDDARRKLLHEIALGSEAVLQAQGVYVDLDFRVIAKV
jgi:hypothetical protein